MRRVAAFALAALGAVAVTGCLGTRPPPAPTHHFLERNYVFPWPADTGLLYEGQAAAHLFLADGLPDAYDRISRDAAVRSASGWRLILTPMFRIRQLKDSSAAVRTPSFMPRISLERTTVTRGPLTTPDSANPGFDAAVVWGLRLTLAHHSNGQAGCFREGFEPVDARSNRCRPIPGADTTIVRLNRASGDFSSTFVNLTSHWTWRNGNDADFATNSLGMAIGVDVHPPGIFGALSSEQRELYGSWRLRGQIERMQVFGIGCRDRVERTPVAQFGCWLRGRGRLTLEGERAPRYPGELARRIRPPVVPYRFSIEVSHALDALLRAGPFVRWHDGQDYYNIGFVHRRRMAVVGLMIDASGADRIGKRVILP